MSRTYDTYRPGSRQDTAQSPYDRPPPPPPYDLPPLPPGPPPPRMFGGPSSGDSYRPSGHYNDYPQRVPLNSDSWRPSDQGRHYSERNDFSFRVNEKAPKYPHGKERDEAAAKYKARLANKPGRAQRSAARVTYAQRQFNRRPPTAGRPLLVTVNGGDSAEQLLGNEQTGTHRFLAAEDLSDSGEDMSESEPDAEDREMGETSISPVLGQAEGINEEEPAERPAKRRALPMQSVEASSAPKWSNPDPYTVLPPVDESQRKKRDVVKLIRKARVTAEKGDGIQNEVSANNDFISFGFDDEYVGEDHDERLGVPGAPTGPRQPDYNIYQGAMNGAPGTSMASTSTEKMGPPPGLPPKPDIPVKGGKLPAPTKAGLPPKPGANEHRPTCESSVGEGSSTTQNGALGTRKRTHNDEIKAEVPRPPPRKKGKGIQSNGSLTSDWIPAQHKDATPWLGRSDMRTESPGFRLHKEICDFFEFVKPQEFEQAVREELIERIQKAVSAELTDCNVHCFGSFAAGLYLPNADMDLVVISNSFRDYGQKVACQTSKQMYKFSNYLRKAVAEPDSVETIVGAKVPIIKFVDKVTAIRVDISFENDTGIIANDTFASWKRQFPAMPILVTLIKQFLMMRGLNEVATGGLGGFSVTCLVTSMLQNMPRVQMGELIPEHHLGEMLLEFLDLYGNQLDIARTGITMNPPGYYDKMEYERRNKSVYRADRADRLAIIDPNKPSNDISGGSKNVSMIFGRFSKAHKEIMAAMTNSRRPSLLDWMLGGDYNNFVWQRKHLQNLFERRWGSLERHGEIDEPTDSDETISLDDDIFNRLDISSVAPVTKAKQNLKAKTKATKVAKPSKSQRRAKTLRGTFASVSEKIPNKVSNPQKLQLLRKLYPDMTPKEQEAFQSLKTHAANKASRKRSKAVNNNAEV